MHVYHVYRFKQKGLERLLRCVSPGSEAAFSESRVDFGEGRVPEGALEVELIQRPKRSLGRAKASPASSRAWG